MKFYIFWILNVSYYYINNAYLANNNGDINMVKVKVKAKGGHR